MGSFKMLIHDIYDCCDVRIGFFICFDTINHLCCLNKALSKKFEICYKNKLNKIIFSWELTVYKQQKGSDASSRMITHSLRKIACCIALIFETIEMKMSDTCRTQTLHRLLTLWVHFLYSLRAKINGVFLFLGCPKIYGGSKSKSIYSFRLRLDSLLWECIPAKMHSRECIL